jgi:nucleolar protein 12
MGIFDAVLGKKDTGGGLFSKKSAFAEKGPNVLAAPLPATAHLAALRAHASRGGGSKRDASSDDDSDSDSDSDDGKRRKKSDKQSTAARRAEERASVEEAYEAAAAVMNDGSGAKRNSGKRDAAAASDTDDEDDSSSSSSDSDGSDGSDSDSDERQPSKDSKKKKASESTKKGDAATAPEEAGDALRRTIFVGNLPVTIKTKKLRAAFAPFGAVASVRLRSVPVDQEGKMPKAGKVITGKLVAERKSTNAYVVFKNEESVAKAVFAMNMKPIEGRHARVDAAAAPSSRANEAKAKALSADLPPGVGITNGGEVAYDHARALFLGNLAYDVDEEDVIAFFHRNKEYPELAGSVEAVRVVRDRATNLGKGIAFVLFRKTGDARVGLLMDGAKMGERAVRVTRASKNRAAAAAGAAAKRKAREEKGRPSGAARRLNLEGDAGNDAGGWEGSRSRPGGKRQTPAFAGGAAAAGAGRGGGGRGGAGGRGGKAAAARTGKRPAVAARKAKAKAEAAGEKKRGV